MTDKLPAGPYRNIEIDSGVQAPFYIIPFDEQGRCQGPLTYNQLLTTVQNGTYTDIFLFSHGWNNDWQTAINSYEGFLKGYTQMRQDHNLTYSRSFRPLLIGIFWPSVILVLPSEQAPAFAGGTDDPQVMDTAVAQERQEIQSLAAMLNSADVMQFYTLTQRGPGLSKDEALELARMLVPLYNTPDDELPEKTPTLSAEDLVKLWQTLSSSTDTSGEFGFADESATTPHAAGLLNFFDPRMIIRAATVLQMKDRASVVGAHGAGPLLTELLKTPSVRIHLIGHSYGCKIVLSALCFQELPRPVTSLLLLQPAISYLCFATADETGTGKPGGYRAAFDRVEQPILTTYSSHDIALRDLFHLAVRRPFDQGEEHIAGDVPPSPYAALGGYGPGGCGNNCVTIDIKPVGQPYKLEPGTCKIYALNSSQGIHSHGDISNDYTWWILYEQVIS